MTEHRIPPPFIIFLSKHNSKPAQNAFIDLRGEERYFHRPQDTKRNFLFRRVLLSRITTNNGNYFLDLGARLCVEGVCACFVLPRVMGRRQSISGLDKLRR